MIGERSTTGTGELPASIDTARSNVLSTAALAAVCLFIASIPTENAFTIPGLGSLSRVLGLAAFALTVISRFRPSGLQLRAPSLIIILLFAYTWWSLATYFWSFLPALTLSEFMTVAQLAVLAWLVLEIGRREADRMAMLQAFVIGCVVLIASVVFRFATGEVSGFRDVGVFNANGVAIVSALAVTMAWRLRTWLLPAPATPLRNFLLVLNSLYPVIALVAVILSASRGGLLTLIVASSVIPLSALNEPSWRRLVMLLVVGLLAVGVFQAAPTVMPDLDENLRRLATTSSELQTGTLTGRTDIWEGGMRLFRESPIIGIGVGVFNYAIEPIIGAAKSPHNAVLAVLVSRGLIGLLLFGGAVLAAVWAAVRAPIVDRPFLLVLMVSLIVAMMPTNSEADKFVWFILAIVAAHGSIVFGSVGARPMSDQAV